MERKNKITSLLLGAAIGDALGVPYEFKHRGTFLCTDMAEYGTWNQPKGTWSDDTSMLLCLAEQIAEGFDLNGLAQKFSKWANKGYMTAHDYVFDIGCTTREAISRIDRGLKPVLCGGSAEQNNGNGSLMRIAPLVFLFGKDMPLLTKFQLVKNVSSVTHAHEISVFACLFYVLFLEELLNGKDKFIAYKNTCQKLSNADFISNDTLQKFSDILSCKINEKSVDKINSGGFVIDTLESSLWCFLNNDNYKNVVLDAVNLGEDTDTTACVAGAMAGLYYNDIPSDWIKCLAKKDMIIDIANRM